MKTHFLFTVFAALLLASCASHEGRKVSSTQDSVEPSEYAKREGNFGREISAQ